MSDLNIKANKVEKRVTTLHSTNEQIVQCTSCFRLTSHIKKIENSKPKRFRNEKYWSRPVPSFGDPKAKLVIIGLAPAANGGNRTGRLFTGDSSGDWLMRALYETGFANQPNSISKYDGLVLNDSYITCIVKCVPPQNIPNMTEISNCTKYLSTELKLLEKTAKVVITLGKISFDTYCKISNLKGLKFIHNKNYCTHDDKILIVSYHPSRRNTNTGVLSWSKWMEIFRKARYIINDGQM